MDPRIVKRFVGAVSTGIVLAATVTGCTATKTARTEPRTRSSTPSQPSTMQPVTTCGYLYSLQAPDREINVGGCAGDLPAMNPQTLTVQEGQTFALLSVTDNGEPVMKAPTTSNSAVVGLVQVFGNGGDGRYKAIAPGAATLSTLTVFCIGGTPDSSTIQTERICPVVEVTVIPR